MKNKVLILITLATLLPFLGKSQNNTFSPYSRYGIGEPRQTTFAHNTGMGGAHIALRPDSTMPIFMNVGNPASYALIRLTTLELGGSFLASTFKGNNNTSLRKWGTNFGYGALGFPVRSNGGACFGIMPFSSVGYETKNIINEENVGQVTYKYNGDGGLNKAFIGYGIMPFKRQLSRFRSKHYYTPDSLRVLSASQYKHRQGITKLLTDFSMGVNVNYIFGSIVNSTRVEYPNSVTYNNTFRERILNAKAFTGNFGAQTSISADSIKDYKGRIRRIEAEVKAIQALGIYTEAEIKLKKDSIAAVTPVNRRAFKQRIRFTFGYFMNVNNDLNANYTTGVYNYVLNGFGQELIQDTVLYSPDKKGSIKMPLEQGFGIGFKKGEKLNVVADFAITNWQNFKYLDEVNDLRKNYRMAIGMNFVPEKYAAGRDAFFKRLNYRLGASYNTGSIYLNNSYISDYSVSAGIGIPVGIGRISSMINISGQYGIMGSSDPTLIKQNYWRVNFGFTFCDHWFQKYRYD